MFPRYIWLAVPDGDPRAAALYKRHYSAYQYADNRRSDPSYRNRNLIAGPGEKMVLLTSDCKALFVWRKFINRTGRQGVNCAVFRNEGAYNRQILSSELILAAERLARRKWPGEPFYTYVNTRAVKGDGLCFKAAGWQKVGRTKKRNLLILQKTAHLQPVTCNLQPAEVPA